MNRTHLDYLASDLWAERLREDLVPWITEVADLGDDVLEIGPGPGLTTDIVRARTDRVTAVEVDPDLGAALAERLSGTNVDVLVGDAAEVDLPAGRFTAATCFSVLHHVPTVEHQDRLLERIRSLLRPGAALFAVDSRDLEFIREAHEDDVFNPLDETTLVDRLRGAGFAEVDLEVGEYELRFVARTADAISG
jgi:SAM-dependent methyltransferase